MDQMESKEVVRENKTNMTSEQQVKAILQETRDLDQKKAAIYEQLMGELEPKGIRLINFNKLSAEEGKLLETYFDVENIAYWLAFQLLTGNTDTQSRNVYLYSPQNSDCWYLLDWDNDGMLRRKEREIIQFSDSESWERGVSPGRCCSK